LAGQRAVELELEAVGLLYRVTPSTLRKIADETPLAAALVREPENTADENAVAVYLNDVPWSNFHIGYLRREVAKEFAPMMDEGRLTIEQAWLQAVDVEAGEGEIYLKAVKRKSLQKKGI
jgi:hypothetical protein